MKNFRKIRLGFLNLTLDFLDEEDLKKAEEYSIMTKEYFKALDIDLIDYQVTINNNEEAIKAWKYLKSQDIDGLVLFNGTFSLSSVTAEIVRNINVPILLWGLDEFGAEKGNFTGSMVGLIASGTIFKNLDKKFTFIHGSIERNDVQEKVKIFINVIRAIAYLKEANIGIMGMRPDGFEISNFDEFAIKKFFGTTIKKISMSYFINSLKDISEKDIDNDYKIIEENFNIKKEDSTESKNLSRIYLALKKVIEQYKLQSYAPDCWPELRNDLLTPICVANGRFNDAGIMASCECDIDGSLTLLLEHALTDSSPWLADFVNFIDDYHMILFWHCGNSPISLSKSKPIIERVSGGLAQTTSLKKGIVTISRINHIKGNFVIHAAIGEVIEKNPLLRGSNLFVVMNCGNKEFVDSLLENGIPHHNGIVYGDISRELKEYSKLMNIPLILK